MGVSVLDLARPRLFGLVQVFVALSALAGAAVSITLQVRAEAYNWDLDHEIYYGQQLAQGQLIWTLEYHDKLPFVQALFLLPGWVGDFRVWQWGSLAAMILAALFAAASLPRIAVQWSLPALGRFTAAGVMFAMFLYWGSTLPGGFTTINIFASSLWLVSIVGLLLWAHECRVGARARILMVLAWMLPAAMAISVRPYLLAPLLVVFAFISSVGGAVGREGILRSRLTSFVVGVGALTLWVVALNGLIYILRGELGALVDGLTMLLQDLNPNPAAETLIDTLTPSAAGFWSLFLASILISVPLALKRSSFRLLMSALALAAVGLLATILRSHWWDHYVQMFIGIAVLTLTFSLIAHSGSDEGTSSRAWRLWAGFARWGLMGLAVTCVSAPALSSFSSLEQGEFGANSSHRESTEVEALASQLQMLDEGDRSFLAPESMYLHWKLNEGRHGFPHAANIEHIMSGWWASVPRSSQFMVARDGNELCDAIQDRGPNLIVLKGESSLRGCLDQPTSSYLLLATLPTKTGTSLLVFDKEEA